MFKGIYTLYRWPVLVLVIIFTVGLVCGSLLPVEFKTFILQAVAEKFGGILDNSPTSLHLSYNIFVNNLTVGAILYVCGFFVVFPAIIVFSNGLLMGVFFSLLYRSDTLQPGQFISSMLSLLPHGVLELSAFFLVGALSIMVTLKAIFHTKIETKKTRGRVLWESLLRFGVIVVPLLITAAAVESYISPWVATKTQDWWLQRTIDSQFAVALNQVSLAEHGCTVRTNQQLTTTTSGESELNLADSFTLLADIVYNETLYDQLRQRKAVPFWEETLYCSNNQVITIQSWPSVQWSQQQAAQLSRGFLTAGRLEYEEYSSTGRNRFTYTTNGGIVAQTIVIVNDLTVAIAQSNSNFTVNEILLESNLTTAN